MKAIPIKKVTLASIMLAAYNPRTITDDELGRLKASIFHHTDAMPGWKKADGFRLVDPLVVNRHNARLVSGHQRVKALQLLGQDWVHADDVRHINVKNEKKEMALNVMLNNRKAQGDWDYPMLKDIVAEIDVGEFDVSQLTGFTADDTKQMFDYVKGPKERDLDENLPVQHKCPKCGYEWSGKPKGKA